MIANTAPAGSQHGPGQPATPNRARRRPNLTLPLPQRDLSSLLRPPPFTTNSTPSSSGELTAAPRLADLERIRRIGSGPGGTVWLVRHRPSSRVYALKVIFGNHEDSIRDQIRRQILRMRTYDSPYVVKCHGMYDHGGEIQILLEYMDGGSLEGRRIADEASLSDVARQVLCGLVYLHKRHIVHHNIKPSNLLINSERRVKIADFGVSRILTQTMDPCHSSMGTIAYVSPERTKMLMNNRKYHGFPSDIWGFGLSILEFYLGRFPFGENLGKQGVWAPLMWAICYNDPPAAPASASREFRDFVGQCLQRDPVRRLTAVQLLQHPFIVQHAGTMQSMQISTLFDGSPVYDREDDKKEIIELVLSDDFKISNVSFICILAPSGTGKSTLVHLVYNEEAVREAFDACIFICFSQKFDENKFMKEMIESLTCSSCRETEMDQLEYILVDELSGKKILLVLDDAENENRRFWKKVETLLNCCSKGSIVLVTTEDRGIAVNTSTKCNYLNPLSDYYRWFIFELYAFSDKSTNAYPELVQIGKKLIEKCWNNLVCIKVLGRLLSCSQNPQFWIAILEDNLWKADRFEFPALQICYNHMAMHLKKCLEYLSLFPKGYIFLKHQIVRIWISAGLVIPVEGREPEGVAASYFDELLSRAFIGHSPIHNAKEDKYIMHDLIRKLAEYNAQYECFRSESSFMDIHKNSIHFSLVPSEYASNMEKAVIEESRNLQTFLVVNNKPSLSGRVLSVLSLINLNDLFIKFSFLRTLDLSYTDIVELPGSIGLLINLSYLGVSSTKITSLPTELCTIASLHTLEAKECYNLVELPKNFKQLTNLRHLDVIKKSSFVKMPVGIGQLTNLRILTAFNVGSEKQQCGIEELKDLNHLTGCLQISGLENIESGASAKVANLKSKVNLETLCLQWSNTNRCDRSATIEEEVFENMEPDNRLKELIVRNYVGREFPIWMGDPSFSELASIIIDKCINCSKFPLLGGLPSLRQLSVQKMYHVERLETIGCSGTNCVFPSLEILNIWEMYDLEELFEVRDGDFPCLRTLSINRCPMLKNIPCFHSLVELSIYSCVKLPCISDLQSLESLRIDGFQKIKSLGLPCNLPMLKSLEIRHCAELLSVEKLSNFASLVKLNVDCCPKFASLDGWVRTDFKAKRCSFIKEEQSKQIEAQQESTKMLEASPSHVYNINQEKNQFSSRSPVHLTMDSVYSAPAGGSTVASVLTFESPEQQSREVNKSTQEINETDPNPKRSHYYKCAYVGCGVKKRVERSLEDLRTVIAGYTGIHNHTHQISSFQAANEPFVFGTSGPDTVSELTSVSNYSSKSDCTDHLSTHVSEPESPTELETEP